MSVKIGQLRQAPEAYEGTLVRVSGEYRRAPVVVCDGVARLSPATWQIGQDDETIGASGFGDLVQTLLPPRLTVTVDGVWRSWRGPLGCGKDAPSRMVWYLAVTEIVSPSPLARVTLTPSGAEAVSTPQVTLEPTENTATPSGPPPVGTPLVEPSPTNRPATIPATTQPTRAPLATSTRIASPTPQEEEEGTVEPTASPPVTATVNGTAGSTATATAQTTPTATASATPGASATPSGTVVDKGNVGFQDLRGSRLDRNETNSWMFSVDAGDVITVSVAARSGTDISLAVLDPAGNRVVQQNGSGAGQIETIAGFETASSGGYRLVISEAGGNETYYSLLILNSNYEESYTFIFAGLLSYGSSASSTMRPDTDQFWFFFGNSQEVVNINVAPNDQSDLFLELYGPEGDLLEDYIDDAAAGGAEQLRNFRLPTTGMYGIHVGEVYYKESNFTILVSRN
ncbi:MAG TPA: hypothetical protein VE553_00050 [Candidatus Binatia bacterium]|nr:hypothetical protein [Candidatus Binatia bacterium]